MNNDKKNDDFNFKKHMEISEIIDKLKALENEWKQKLQELNEKIEEYDKLITQTRILKDSLFMLNEEKIKKESKKKKWLNKFKR